MRFTLFKADIEFNFIYLNINELSLVFQKLFYFIIYDFKTVYISNWHSLN